MMKHYFLIKSKHDPSLVAASSWRCKLCYWFSSFLSQALFLHSLMTLFCKFLRRISSLGDLGQNSWLFGRVILAVSLLPSSNFVYCPQNALRQKLQENEKFGCLIVVLDQNPNVPLVFKWMLSSQSLKLLVNKRILHFCKSIQFYSKLSAFSKGNLVKAYGSKKLVFSRILDGFRLLFGQPQKKRMKGHFRNIWSPFFPVLYQSKLTGLFQPKQKTANGVNDSLRAVDNLTKHGNKVY